MDKSVSNLKEVITRGAKVLVVTNRDVRASDIDTLIRVPETHPLLAPGRIHFCPTSCLATISPSKTVWM